MLNKNGSQKIIIWFYYLFNSFTFYCCFLSIIIIIIIVEKLFIINKLEFIILQFMLGKESYYLGENIYRFIYVGRYCETNPVKREWNFDIISCFINTNYLSLLC
jgi:hypothetical protein